MRLITRGDLDGLTSAVILTLVEPIDEIKLIHPQDITDKRVEIRGDDILANVPYDPRCGMWFDHHLLTSSNETPPEEFKGRYGLAPSAARLVYDYSLERHPGDERLLRLARLVAETGPLHAAPLTPQHREDPPRNIPLLQHLGRRADVALRRRRPSRRRHLRPARGYRGGCHRRDPIRAAEQWVKPE